MEKKRKEGRKFPTSQKARIDKNPMIESDSAWIFWLSGLLLVILAVDFRESLESIDILFARINILKTFLFFAAVTCMFMAQEIASRKQKNLATVGYDLGWIFILSLPLLATMPGLILHGANNNYLLGHEISVHIMYMLWVLFFIRSISQSKDFESLLIFIGIIIIYVVWIGFVEGDRARPKSTFGNTNLYANFLITAMPLFVAYLMPIDFSKKGLKFCSLTKEAFLQKIFFLMVCIIGFYGLWQTQSRSAIAGLVISLGIFFFYLLYQYLHKIFNVRGTRFLLYTFIFGVLSLSFVFIGISQFDEIKNEGTRFFQLISWEGWTSRFIPWEVAWLSIQDAPVFGYGPGSSYNLFFEYLTADSRLYLPERSFKHPHSEFLEAAQEGGVLGISFYIFVICLIFWLVCKLLLSERLGIKDRKIAIGAGLGLLAYVFHGAFSLASRMTQNEMFAYSLVAILIFLLKKSGIQDDLTGKFRSLVAFQIQGGLKTSFVLFILILLAWTIQFPQLQGSSQLARLHQLNIKTKADIAKIDVDRLVEVHQYSPSIYVQRFIASLQMVHNNGKDLPATLDRIDAIIPHYQDADYLRFVALQLKSTDLDQLQILAERYQARDRYHRKTIQWLAKIAASKVNAEDFLAQIRLVVQYHAAHFQLIDPKDIENVEVSVSSQVKGMEINFDKNKIILEISKQQLEKMMSSSRRALLKRKKLAKNTRNYQKQMKLIKPSPNETIHRNEKECIKQITQQIGAWGGIHF